MQGKQLGVATIISATLFIIAVVLAILVGGSTGSRAATASSLSQPPHGASPIGTPACLPWHSVDSPNSPTWGSVLSSAAVVASDDVWAVGAYSSGSISQTLTMHWDGTSWSIVPSPNPGTGATAYLNGVAAVSANDVWSVGYAYSPQRRTLIEHWDGTQWTIVISPNVGNYSVLQAVAVVSATDVWAVGYTQPSGGSATLTLHYDGTQWSIVPSANSNLDTNKLYAVSALSSSDVWAVGAESIGGFPNNILIEHWNGAAWYVLQAPYGGIDSKLYSVSAVAPNDVWAVGEAMEARTLIMHYDGSHWDFSYSPDLQNATLKSVNALSATDVWAAGYYRASNGSFQSLIEHWNGTNWSIVPGPNPLDQHNRFNGLAPVDTHDLWAVGYYDTTSSTTDWTLTARYEGGIIFSDVYPDDYFRDAVNFLYCRGAISGYADNTFRPSNNTTRGQLCKIVVLAEDWTLYIPASPTYRDVPSTHPMMPYIETATHQGVVSGYNCGTGCLEFRPDNNITRGQLCKVVVLAEGWPLYTPPTPTFQDVPTTHAQYAYIETAYNRGIISGYGDGTFRPGNSATRGQISKIVYNAITAP